jgi:hypothetical protein
MTKNPPHFYPLTTLLLFSTLHSNNSIIFFSEEGIFLICKEEIFHDILELDESDNRTKSYFDTGKMHYELGFDLDMQYWSFENYARMASSYSHRSLTFPSDTYFVISGVIRRAAQNLSTSFVAALPVHSVCNALLWFHHAGGY